MTDGQNALFVKLAKKYGFEQMGMDIDQARFMSLMLGVAYELTEKSICRYLDVKSSDLREIDLLRICEMLGIPMEETFGKDVTLDRLREYIHGGTPQDKQVEEEHLRLDRYEKVMESFRVTLDDLESGDVTISLKEGIERKYQRLTSYVLEQSMLSSPQLQQVIEAMRKGLPEEYILRFAKPEMSAAQMEKAIELYLFRQVGDKKVKKHMLSRRGG